MSYRERTYEEILDVLERWLASDPQPDEVTIVYPFLGRSFTPREFVEAFRNRDELIVPFYHWITEVGKRHDIDPVERIELEFGRGGKVNLEKIRWEQSGAVLTLKIANGKANTISRQVIEELHRVLDEAERRENVKEIVITGDGDRFFSAGADINEIAEFVLAGEDGRKPMTREERMRAAYEFSKRGQNLVLRLRNFPKPVTALINGMCFGGGFELALGCHRRVATANAVMGLPEVTLGIIPGWGGTVFLAKIVAERISDQTLQVVMPSVSREKMGTVAAFGIIKSAFFLVARGALNLGIADEVVDGPYETVPPSPRQVAPGATSAAGEFVKQQQELDEEEALEEEANYFVDLCVLPEAQEGIRAFLEKRAPNFTKS